MKTKLKSFGIKSLAAILSILMVLTGFPLSVFAIDFESDSSSTEYHLQNQHITVLVKPLKWKNFVKNL